MMLLIIAAAVILTVIIAVISVKREFPPIRGPVVGIDVDYNANNRVRSSSDVETVFNKFILYAKENNKEISPGPILASFVDDWRFENATIHGTYKGL